MADKSTLVNLGDTSSTIPDDQPDVRGRTVVDADGEEVGEVDELLVDAAESQVRMLCVKHGGFLGIGADHFLVPVDAVTSVEPEAVHIDRERSKLTDVPGYDPDVEHDPDEYDGVYKWWGYPSYWSAGYIYPITFKDVPPY